MRRPRLPARARPARPRSRPEPEPDAALRWIALATAGMLNRSQVQLMDEAIRAMPEGAVVEIGSFAGQSTATLLRLLRLHGRGHPLFTADPWDFERTEDESGRIPGSTVAFADVRANVREQFERNVRLWGEGRLPHSFELHSDAFFAAWAAGERRRDAFGFEATLGGEIALAFVDGDHRVEQATRDAEHACAHLAAGGFLLLDDSDPRGPWPHLAGLAERLVGERRLELVAAAPNHLLRKP